MEYTAETQTGTTSHSAPQYASMLYIDKVKKVMLHDNCNLVSCFKSSGNNYFLLQFLTAHKLTVFGL